MNFISSDTQLSLIIKVLNFILYRNFVDIYARVQNYVIVSRESAEKNTRKLGVPTNIPWRRRFPLSSTIFAVFLKAQM